MRTINAQIRDINNKIKTAEEIVKTEEISTYAIKYFSPDTQEESLAYRELKSEWEKVQKPIEKIEKIEKDIKFVKCNCGHTVPETWVMGASTGSSCPDCFDRMS